MKTKEVPNGHEVRSRKSTRALIRAAGDLIAEGGYQTMTLATVGERAGYSRSLATARFGSKAKLLEALVEEIVVRWNVEKIEPESEGLSGLATLRALLVGIRDAYVLNPRTMSVLYALIFEALGPAPDLRERFTTFHHVLHDRISSAIKRGIEDGSVREDVDAEQHADVIVAQLRGIGYLWKLDPENYDTNATLTLFIEQWLQVLAVQETAKESEFS